MMNYENGRASGEDWLLGRVVRAFPQPTVLDVGGNVGAYATAIKRLDPAASVYCFEPHPATFDRMRLAAERWRFVPVNVGLSDDEGILELHDYGGRPDGTAHASLHKGVIEELHHAVSASQKVAVTTLDRFLDKGAISRVNLLKIDTEGHEYQVLAGAREALGRGEFDVIHFEFNEMNVLTRHFLRDFRSVLPDFTLHRLLPRGLLALPKDEPPMRQEVFAYQNIVAIRESAADVISG